MHHHRTFLRSFSHWTRHCHFHTVSILVSGCRFFFLFIDFTLFMDTRLRYVTEWDQHSASPRIHFFLFFLFSFFSSTFSLIYTFYIPNYSFVHVASTIFIPPLETHLIKTSTAAPQAALSGTACNPALYNIYVTSTSTDESVAELLGMNTTLQLHWAISFKPNSISVAYAIGSTLIQDSFHRNFNSRSSRSHGHGRQPNRSSFNCGRGYEPLDT